MDLHLGGSNGYELTGAKANLFDADKDGLIAREAGYFWRKLGMRAKVAAAVAEVKEEVDAGRLRWCYRDIMRQILPHPRRKGLDDVLAAIDGDVALDVADADVEDEDAMRADEDDEDPIRADEDDEDDSDWGNAQDIVETLPHGDDSGASAVAGVSPALAPAEAQAVLEINDVIVVYETVAAELRSWGNVSAAAFIDTQRDKERRRLRELSRDDPDVLKTLLKWQDDLRADERKRKRLHDESHQRTLELSGLRREIKLAGRTLQERKARIMDAEATLHIKHEVRRFSPEDLGRGKRNCGGASCKANRVEVLKRMARLGSGLSAAQKSEFNWFCDTWDTANMEDFGEGWPDTFSTWIQNVLEDHENSVVTAFSQFVHSETTRCLAGAVALALPADPAA